MESSKFIQISPDILIEYVYTSQSAPTKYNTGTYPVEIMRDGHTGGSYMFNSDSVSATMGNYRDISGAAINENKTKFAYLDTSVGVPYNDFDPLLTDSAALPQTFAPNIDIEYDRIRVHFVAGYTFTGFDGLILETLVPNTNGVMLNLSSIVFLKSDTPVFNPDPLLLADKLYSTFIEWRVPSLFFMNNTFTPLNTNTLAYKLTEGKGFLPTPTITLKVSGIFQTELVNSYRIFSLEEVNSVTIPNRDIYDNLFASVEEADGADYFELTGKVTGSSFSNFIASLNAQGANYVVFHEINVSEQIGLNFINTSTQMFTQTNDFDLPILFRPIILNSAIAASFSINYVLRLFNRDDNTQIIKNAKLTSFDAKKYGKRLMKINLGTVPTVANVYNKIAANDGSNIVVTDGNSNNSALSSDDIAGRMVVKTKYVTAFKDKIKVKAAISPAKIQNISETDGDTN
mgnify:CR=1 FL=1